MRSRRWSVVVLLVAAVLAACARPDTAPLNPAPLNPAPLNPAPLNPAPGGAGAVAPAAQAGSADGELDDWEVGATPLPQGPDGYGQVRPTPRELRERRLPSPDVLPAPRSSSYESSISPVPADVLARSTWRPECPVRADELRYLTMSFIGFDGQPHTGEMIVHTSVATEVVEVFDRLFRARFPIEQMRVVAASELDAAPTGDGNNTTSFVCRPAVGLGRWSAHAAGLAIDVNPFHNPYARGELVLPELASAYLDRDWKRPGMVFDGGPVVGAFESVGWAWGGRWTSPVDYQHFSATGR